MKKQRLAISVPAMISREAKRNKLPVGRFVSFLLDNLTENPGFVATGAKISRQLEKEAA